MIINVRLTLYSNVQAQISAKIKDSDVATEYLTIFINLPKRKNSRN